MARRSTAGRRSINGPLVGTLQELDRRTRTMAPRRRAPAAAEPAPALPGPPGPPGRVPATVLTTGGDGRATWALPAPMEAPPVVTALPQGQEPLLAVLEEVTGEAVTVRVWALAPRRAPAGPGIPVHVSVVPRQ